MGSLSEPATLKPKDGPGLRWIDRFNVALAVAGGVACLAMVVNIVADVLGREVFRPLPGTVDVTQFAWMPALVSLGLGYALQVDQHIRISLVTGSAGYRVQRVVEVMGMAVTLGTVAAFTWFGFDRAMISTEQGEFTSSTPWLPVWLFRWVLVVGLVGFALQAFAQIVRAMTSPVFHSESELAGTSFAGDATTPFVDVEPAGRGRS